MPAGSDAFAGVQQSVGHQVGGDQGSGGFGDCEDSADDVEDGEDDEDDDHDDVFTSDGPLAAKKSLDQSPLMIFSTCR